MNPVLGIDFGRARVGVAISDELRMLAHPLETVPAGKGAVARISQIVGDRKIERVVVGVPRTMRGEMGPAAQDVMVFIEQLRASLDCPVLTWDERLTTVAAERALRDAGKKTKATRGYVDQVAAQMILQGYLDQQSLMGGHEEQPGAD